MGRMTPALLICAGRPYLKSTQVMGTTHMLAVALDGSRDA